MLRHRGPTECCLITFLQNVWSLAEKAYRVQLIRSGSLLNQLKNFTTHWRCRWRVEGVYGQYMGYGKECCGHRTVDCDKLPSLPIMTCCEESRCLIRNHALC